MSWSIDRYLNVRQAYAPSFAPDGKALAFLANITGVPEVWQVPLPDTDTIPWPDQLTFEGDRVSAVAYAPAGGDPSRARSLVYITDVGGSEQHQINLLDVERAVVVPLTGGHAQAMHLFGSWAPNGRQICFAANRRDPGLFDLYLQSVGQAEGRDVGWDEARVISENDEPGYLQVHAFAPEGDRVIASLMRSSFDHTLLEFKLATGQALKLLERSEPVRFIDAKYAPDGRSLYLITDLDSDYLYIARLDLQSGVLEALANPSWNCESMALSTDGMKLAYAVNVEGGDRLFVLNLESWTTVVAPEFAKAPGVVTDARLAFSPDDRFLAFSFTDAVRTADIFLWDLTPTVLDAPSTVGAVTASSHGGLPVAAFAAPALIHYPTFDRDDTGELREIPAWFFRPTQAGEAPLPVVVIVHGGPEGQFRPAFHFLVQYLMHHGYAVLAPNVRGSTGYGKTYSHLDDVEKRMDSVTDLAYAARWLQAQPGIDGRRLVVYGGSYGGFMVLAALTNYPELWAAGVDIVGISNLASFLEHTSDYRRAHREAEYGSLEHDREFLERIAPIHHVDQIACPLMVIHGRNDPRVPLSEAEQLVAALEVRDVSVRFLVFDDEGHGVVKLKNKLVAYPAIIDFLNEHVMKESQDD
jgi:dipeptidyl aminopeptidase/acylaminoacyl peptidase